MTNQSEIVTQAIASLILTDPFRMRCLHALRRLGPQFYIGGGVIRNLVWDHRHGHRTRVNDVDVVYYDGDNRDPVFDRYFLQRLQDIDPCVPWEVINQANMRTNWGKEPLHSLMHAISTWVEKPTCVACRLDDGGLTIISGYGLESLWNLELECVVPEEQSFFEERLREKRWLEIWPKLRIVDNG